MKEFKRILVPVDGSKISDLALDRAIKLARLVEGSVHLVHVRDREMASGIGLEANVDRETEEEGKKMLSSREMKVKDSGIHVSTHLETGSPGDLIVERSKDHDLIIMGTRGRNPLASILLGSVAENVVRKASCPVMLVREKRSS